MWTIDNERWVQIVTKDPRLDPQIAVLTWEEIFQVENGKPFITYWLLDTPSTGEKHLLIKIHHAMYDGTLL